MIKENHLLETLKKISEKLQSKQHSRVNSVQGNINLNLFTSQNYENERFYENQNYKKMNNSPYRNIFSSRRHYQANPKKINDNSHNFEYKRNRSNRLYSRNNSYSNFQIKRISHELYQSQSFNKLYKRQKTQLLKHISQILQNSRKKSYSPIIDLQRQRSESKFRKHITQKIDKLQSYLVKIKRQRQKQNVPTKTLVHQIQNQIQFEQKSNINIQLLEKNYQKNSNIEKVFAQIESLKKEVLQLKKSKQKSQVKQSEQLKSVSSKKQLQKTPIQSLSALESTKKLKDIEPINIFNTQPLKTIRPKIFKVHDNSKSSLNYEKNQISSLTTQNFTFKNISNPEKSYQRSNYHLQYQYLNRNNHNIKPSLYQNNSFHQIYSNSYLPNKSLFSSNHTNILPGNVNNNIAASNYNNSFKLIQNNNYEGKPRVTFSFKS